MVLMGIKERKRKRFVISIRFLNANEPRCVNSLSFTYCRVQRVSQVSQALKDQWEALEGMEMRDHQDHQVLMGTRGLRYYMPICGYVSA